MKKCGMGDYKIIFKKYFEYRSMTTSFFVFSFINHGFFQVKYRISFSNSNFNQISHIFLIGEDSG